MTEVKPAKIWNKMYTCAFVANFLLCVSQFLVNPLVTEYARLLGADDVKIGVITGLYFGVAFLARPFSGPAITKLNKKYIMLFAYMMGFVVNVGYALSNSIPLFVVSRILHGVQFAFIGSLNLTLASDSLPQEKMGSGLGMFGVGGAVATAIAPSFAIALSSWGEQIFKTESAGYTVVFSVAAVCMLISVAPCLIMPYKPLTNNEKSQLGAWYKSIIATEAFLPAIVILFYALGSIIYTAYMIPLSKELGIENIGLFYTVYALAILAARPLSGRLIDRFGEVKVIIPGSFIFAASFIVTGTSHSLTQILVGAVLAAIGYGSAQPALQTMAMRSVEPARRGSASNTNYFGLDLGFFIGPTLAGFIIANGTHARMFVLAVIPILLSTLIFLLGLKPYRAYIAKKLKQND
ncbi:MAG: MFS transporter [Oscillospiraceae bacterium]|jgi:MFS family permease|nr:MFS transporter [Oscillospiraceae bacterium]